jgi:hypothetical protein
MTPIELRYQITECDTCDPQILPVERFLVKFKGSLKLHYFWKINSLYFEVLSNEFVLFDPDKFANFERVYLIDYQNALNIGETIP